MSPDRATALQPGQQSDTPSKKEKESFIDGELVKLCLIGATKKICSEKNLFKTISLSARTAGRKTEDTGSNISR